MVAAFRGPIRIHPRIKGPIRHVNPVQRIGQRGACEPVRREPAGLVPSPEPIAHLCLIQDKREHALRADRRLHLLVRDDLRRTAELAALRHLAAIEHRNRLATLAPHRNLLRLPSALLVRQLTQGRDEIVFFHSANRIRRRIHRRGRAAERADQRLLRRVPMCLRAASRAGELFARDSFHLLGEELVQRRPRDSVGRADFLCL
jgi:hypothetical protein